MHRSAFALKLHLHCLPVFAAEREHRFGITIRADLQAVEVLLLLAESSVIYFNDVISFAWKRVVEACIHADSGRVFIARQLFAVCIEERQSGIDGRTAAPRFHFEHQSFPSFRGNAKIVPVSARQRALDSDWVDFTTCAVASVSFA